MRDSGLSPQSLEDKPDLHEWMVEYLNGFEVLNRTRQMGMGIQPIQLSEILAYLQIFGTLDAERFVTHVVTMDSAYLGVMAKKTQNPSATPPAPAQSKSKEAKPDGRQSTSSKRERRPVDRNG